MKYCLNSRQAHEYLLKADELKVEYRDRKSIPDLAEQYPNKTIILLRSSFDDELVWKEIKEYNILTHGKLLLCLGSMSDCEAAKENDVKFYFGFPANTWYELRAMIDIGVSYVLIGAPLFFDMDKLATVEIPFRIIPNVAYLDGFIRKDGVCGTWVRPEDMHLYEDIIDTVEFSNCDIKKEQALYRIYAEQKAWPGDLSFIINGLEHKGVNRMLTEELTTMRMNCHQRCMDIGSCRYCYRALDLADPDLIKNYMASDKVKD